MMIRFLVLIVGLVFMSSQAIAAPSKPTVTLGETTITLTGTDFSTKPTAAPLLFDNFESGSLSASISTSANWSTDYYYSLPSTTAGSDPIYSNSNARTGSTRHSYHELPVGGASKIISNSFSPAFDGANSSVYVSFWYWYDRLDTDTDCQLKIGRVYNSETAEYPSYAYYNLLVGEHQEYRTSDGANCSAAITQSGEYFDDTQSEWRHMEWIIDTGTIGGYGSHNTFLNGVLVGEDDGTETMYSNSSCTFNRVRFGEWHANANCETNTDITMFDDIYVDNSFARVMVCNAAQTHCELQIPTSWSDTSIVATLNQGSFSDSESVYASVVDISGDVGPVSDAFTFASTPPPSSSTTAITTGTTAISAGTTAIQ